MRERGSNATLRLLSQHGNITFAPHSRLYSHLLLLLTLTFPPSPQPRTPQAMPTPTASSSLTPLAPPAPSQPPVDTPHFSSNNPSSSRLSTALHLKQSLLDRLEAAQTQLHLLHNLQQRHTERQQRVEDETSQERRARKAREQDEIRDKRGQVARERERRATKERVKEACVFFRSFFCFSTLLILVPSSLQTGRLTPHYPPPQLPLRTSVSATVVCPASLPSTTPFR